MRSRLARSAGLISIAVLASRVLGVVRESVLASYFGASASMQMDAYNVAFRIPNLLRDLFAEGAMTAAFVPTFTRTLTERGREQAWRLGNLVINSLALITGLLAILGMIFAEPITRLIVAPEFVAIPGKLDLTVELTRVMLPFLTTVAVAVAAMGMLNSLRKFFVPALSSSMFNVATILCAIVLTPILPRFGVPGIYAIGIGTVLGGVGQILLQWPLLRKEGFRYRPMLDFRDPDLRQVLRMMLPGTLGVAAVNINVLVNNFLATGLENGAPSWLGYAFRLMYLPIGLFGVSIATASIPEVARHAAAKDHDAVRHTVSGALRMMLMLNVPAMIGLMVLAEPIVALLYQRGAFHVRDTQATAAALMFYAPGLVGYSIVKIASPTFYSLGDSRTPAIVSVSSVLMNVLLNLALVRAYGHRGLALGTAIAALLNAGLLLYLLQRRLHGLEGPRLFAVSAKIVVASLAMGAVAVVTSNWAAGHFGVATEWGRLLRVMVAIAAAVAALAIVARLLRIEEFTEATRRVVRRIAPERR